MKQEGQRYSQLLERMLGFAPLSLVLVFGAALVAVVQAYAFADGFYDSIAVMLNPVLRWINVLPGPLASTLGGDYGVMAMFPFLFLLSLIHI